MNKQKLDTHSVKTKKGRLLYRPLFIVLFVMTLLRGTAVTFSLEQTQSLPPEFGYDLKVSCAGQGLNNEIASYSTLKLICPTDGYTPALTIQQPPIKNIIYISPDGNDNWAGTRRRPLRTIQKGVDLANAGQMVLVRGGMYAEQVIISNSGTRFRPLIIAAFPGETPVIDGQYQLPSTSDNWADCNDTVSPPKCFNYEHLVRIEGDHVIFNGFEIRHSLGRGLVVYRYDDIPTGIVITNNNIHDNRNAGILLHEANGIIISNNDLSYNSNYATHDRDPNQLNWAAGAISVRSENIVYHRNIIHNNWGEGLITSNYSGSTNIVIDDNIFYDNYALQLYVHRSHNVKVQQNLVYCTDDSRFFRGDDYTYGIIVANEQPPEGFEDGLRTKNIDIVNNIVTGCQQNFGVWGSDSADEDYPIINMLVAHNTFVNAKSISEPNRARNISWTNYNYENVWFKNNIIYQQDGVPIHLVRDYPGLTLENNLWSIVPTPVAVGSGDIVGDPNLVNPNAPTAPNQVDPAWYMLQPSSVAIGAAEPIVHVLYDFFGNRRDNDPDIGAHESQ